MANVKAMAKGQAQAWQGAAVNILHMEVSEELGRRGCVPFLLDNDGPTTLRDGLRSIAGDTGQARGLIIMEDVGLWELPPDGPVRCAALEAGARKGLELAAALVAREIQLTAPCHREEFLDLVQQHQDLAGFAAWLYDAAQQCRPLTRANRDPFVAPAWSWPAWWHGYLRDWFSALEAAAVQAQVGAATAGADDRPPPLTGKESVVLRAMAAGGGKLLTIPKISSATTALGLGRRIGPKTVGEAVTLFEKEGLAERPKGPKCGARLTVKGLQIAASLPDH